MLHLWQTPLTSNKSTMSNWTDGYVADIGYTFGYYPELNPLRIKLAFLDAGLVFPECSAACELGFGQGLSANIHAAATVTEWFGTDFNPAQAHFAQELAEISGNGAKLYDDAFASFCERQDLPDFDFIGLHGIWSWISDANRTVIVDFIRRKLKVGGVLYISYNTFPGWAAFAPMRHLMQQHAEVIGVDGDGLVKRVDGAIDFADRLLATNPLYARSNAQIALRIKKLKEQNRNYLAHEYFNHDWQPMHFATMGEWLSPAKVTYACSAHYQEHIDAMNLTAEQQLFLKEIADPLFRESVRDFMVNQQFRRDYWVKGARLFSGLERSEVLRQQKVILVSHRPDVTLRVSGALGEAAMSEAVYNPVLDFLADHKPKSIGDIESAFHDKGIGFAQLLQVVLVLIGSGDLAAVQDEALTDKVRKHTDKLNASLYNKARGSNDITYLASPVTGGGVQAGRFQQLFLLALSQGKKQPAEMARFVWQILEVQGQKIVKEKVTLETPEENIAELTAQAASFCEKQLPVYKALQIV
jgi:SAM-dependent methyltransferase